MRNSKILKIICYITLPIFIGIIILATFYIELKDSTYYSTEEYFNSEDFLSTYMSKLSTVANRLIYSNPQYNNIKDGDTYIFYSPNGEFDYNSINMYFLIIYKNKAFTNVELTSEVSTIETIKKYISNIQDNKSFNIIGGKVESDSEILTKRAEQYLGSFVFTYYTRDTDDNNSIEIDDSYLVDSYVSKYNSNINYITTNINDFSIYSSYSENFIDTSRQLIICKFIERLRPYENVFYIAMPICTILSVLILVYLLVSVGHKKGVKGISTSDFDKIPLEIICFIAICLIGMGFVLFIEEFETTDFNLMISLIFTVYFTTFIICSIIFDTVVKRIKSRTFWKTTLIGKIAKVLLKIILKPIHKFETFIGEVRGTSKYFSNATKKFIMFFFILVFLAFIVFILFRSDPLLFLLLEFALVAIFIQKMVKAISDYDKIERKLKEMYEGNNQNTLNKEEFLPVFYQSITYLNDVSNGLENAIQDRMKSERLKTELITNVSHDIKTPLTSIINYVDLIKQENIQNEKVKEYIEILDNKSQRLKKLIEDLVEASKVSTGNVKLNLEKINIVELINQAVGEFEDKFEANGLDIVINTNESEIYIMVDSRYMYRIIENLFSNISKYALQNSRVYIDLQKIEEKVFIKMKNISKDKLNIPAEELMQRFVRGDKSRTTEGSGLGISIAQNLTEIQNGKFNLIIDGDLFKTEIEFSTI